MDDYSQLRSLLLEGEQNLKGTVKQLIKDIRSFANEIHQELEDRQQNFKQFELESQLQKEALEKRLTLLAHNIALQTQQQEHLAQQFSQNTQQLAQLENNLQRELSFLKNKSLENQKYQEESYQQYQHRLALLEKHHPAELVTRLEDIENRWNQIVQIEARLSDTEQRINDLATLLPSAIRQAVQQSFEEKGSMEESELTASLKEPVKVCLKQSVVEDTQSLADTLFPVMGPAIRKSVNETIKGLLLQLNSTIESGLSPRNFAWRFESMRSGVPYSEIVLQRTMVYRVEQVFLIHRQSGLLIQHVHQSDIENIGDSAAISGMFTAIQDFIRDSFSGARSEELDSVDIGEYTVWLERSPNAVLACVVRGVAPYKLRDVMRSLLETLHVRYAKPLERFEGDSEEFESAIPLLYKALQSEKKADFTKPTKFFSTPLIIVLLLFALVLGGTSFIYYRHQWALECFLTELKETKGIVVTETTWQYGTITVHVLRDPLSPKVEQLIEENELQGYVTIKSRLYHDLTDEYILKRAKAQLHPPDTVQFDVYQGQLKVNGHAPAIWITDFNQRVNFISGVTFVDTQRLEETDLFLQKQAMQQLKPPATVLIIVKQRQLSLEGEALEQDYYRLQTAAKQIPEFVNFDFSNLINVSLKLQTLKQNIENVVFYFDDDVNLLQIDKNFELFFNSFKPLNELAKRHHQRLQFTLTGYTDGLGTQQRNEYLSKQRSEYLSNELQKRGVAADLIKVMTPANLPFGEFVPDYSRRNVRIKIDISSEDAAAN